MVGREPDLNPPIDWEKEWSKFLRPVEPPINPAPRRATRIPVKIVSENPDYKERLATPLVQVFSISISSNFDDGKPCELYGSVQVMEGASPFFYLYDRASEDFENIKEQCNLSLIDTDGGVIVPSLSTVLNFCLKDKVRGVDVVNGKLDFDKVSEDSYDTLLMDTVECPHGVAKVHYVVFRFALYGTVNVIINNIDNNEIKCNAAEIYGSVVAGYENGRVYCADGDEEKLKYMETRLFDKTSDQPLPITVGTPIRLSRNIVAVPTYSSFTVEVNLWDSNGKIAGGCLKFPAHLLGDVIHYIKTQNACVEVRVRWWHAYDRIYNRTKLEKERQLQKNPRVPHDQQLPASLVPRNLPSTSRTASLFGNLKVEVFTVFVSGITKKVSNLCGTMIIEDGSDRFSIYNRDESSSELLPDHSLASIEVNYRAIQNSEFWLTLDLKDPVRKLEVSRGTLSWNVCRLESSMLWYGKRLCSVVRGKDGYAAVHYEVFNSAYEAHLVVNLFAKGNLDKPISLFGTLIARYSVHDYSSSYHKKYCTSRLFDCPRNRSREVKACSEIEMLKSIVVVSTKSALVIEANLGIIGTNKVEQSICGDVEFMINTDMISQIIQGEDYWIQVEATFKK